MVASVASSSGEMSGEIPLSIMREESDLRGETEEE
jgi:hypothetical protein